MRKLQTSDVFELARLIKRAGIKDELKDVALKANKEDIEGTGFDLIFGVVEKLTEQKVEDDLYKFLSGPLEESPEEVKVMDPLELVEKIMRIADMEKWKAFLKLAVR